MLTEKSPTHNASSTLVSLGLKVLFERTDISALLQKQIVAEFGSKYLQTLVWEPTPEILMPSSEQIKASEQEQVELDPYPESDYQWLVEVLEALSDIVSQNVNNDFAALTETDYEQLDAVLKELIYIVGDDEKHPLAPLMDFIGILTTKYENKHFPKLTDLFPELAEDVNPNDTENENQQDNPTKEPEKSVNLLAAEAFYSVGGLLLEGDKNEEAIAAYNQAIRFNPDYAEAYYCGETERSLGQYESASVAFDEAIRINPVDAYAYFKRADVKCELSQYEAAIADYSEAIQLKPDLSQAYKGRGDARRKLGQFDTAIVDYDKAIQLSPDAVTYYDRGYIKGQLGRHESAIRDYSDAIRINPDDANTDCTNAICLNPNYAEAYDTRGKAKVLLGRTQEAKADFQKALELAEQSDNQNLKSEIQQSLQEFDNTN